MTNNSIQRAYWLTFRLAEDEHYDDRYNALMDCTLDVSSGPQWVEPTSFVMFKSILPPLALAARIEGVIDPKGDVVLLTVVGGSRAWAVGKLEDPLLLKMWPGVSLVSPGARQGRISGALSQAPAKSGRR